MRRSSRFSLALHALVHLSKQPETALTSAALAQCLLTNPVVVRRALGELREAGLVTASKGPDGGWRLAHPAAEISLALVYRAMGETLLVRAESDPGDRACGIVRTVDQVMGEVLHEAERLLAERLDRLSLADLAAAALPHPLPHSQGVRDHG